MPAALPTTIAPPASLSRAYGRVALGYTGLHGVTHLGDLYQQGCGRVRFPRPEHGTPEAVLINTAGGLTDHDRLDLEVSLGRGAQATVTTQSAERVYRSLGAPAVVCSQLRVAAGARLEWLPQETIMFNRGRLQRSTEVTLAAHSTLLACEAVIFGRAAHGETVHEGYLSDRWHIRREGRLVWADTLRLDGDVAQLLDRPALGNGARGVATVWYVSSDVDQRLLEVRDALVGLSARTAASVRRGVLVVRLLADDGAVLRQGVAHVVRTLRGGRPMPRVWQC